MKVFINIVLLTFIGSFAAKGEEAVKPWEKHEIINKETVRPYRFADCTKEDKCTYEPCDSAAVLNYNNDLVGRCRKVFKFDKAKSRHVFAFYELGISTTTVQDGKSTTSANLIRLK